MEDTESVCINTAKQIGLCFLSDCLTKPSMFLELKTFMNEQVSDSLLHSLKHHHCYTKCNHLPSSSYLE